MTESMKKMYDVLTKKELLVKCKNLHRTNKRNAERANSLERMKGKIEGWYYIAREREGRRTWVSKKIGDHSVGYGTEYGSRFAEAAPIRGSELPEFLLQEIIEWPGYSFMFIPAESMK